MATRSPKYSSKTTGSSRERRIRQILAYFAYYSGGVIDVSTAFELFVMYGRFQSSPSLEMKYSVRQLTTPKDVRESMHLLKTLLRLGTKGDSGKTPQFLNLGNDRLACRELPNDFYESFFSLEEKEKLDFTLILQMHIPEKERVDIHTSTEGIRKRINPEPPGIPWEGFDPKTAIARAEQLKEERMAKLLEKYPHLDVDLEDE